MLEAGTVAALVRREPVTQEAVVSARLIVVLTLALTSAVNADAQSWLARRAAACRCEPTGKPRKPRFLLPVAGGIGFIPIALAARDSQLPAIGLPSLVDIRDATPRNALEGERELEVGALAPDTATVLPTVMLLATILLAGGAICLIPRRRRRRLAFWRSPARRQHGGWRLRTIHRRRVGIVLAGGGSLLLALGSREYAEGAEAQRQARAAWLRAGSAVIRIDESQSGSPTVRIGMAERDGATTPPTATPNAEWRSVVPLPIVATSGREIRRGTPVARLVIPSIDLDEIVTEGVGPVELNGGPGHFPGSVLPGDLGNAIVSAHRDRHFRRVGELTVGTHFRTDTHSRSVEWVVTERRIVSRDTPALFDEPDATLTLTTCWPIRYFGPAPDRLLIIAKPVT
jgi:LPXTG-site transpeptidase (sortase) family protein